MGSLRFKLDIDRLGELIKADGNVVDTVEFKDGSKHRMVTISIMERMEAKNNSTHYLRVDMYHKQEIQGVNYFLGDCYPINFGKGSGVQQEASKEQPPTPQQQPQPSAPAQDGASDDLPF